MAEKIELQIVADNADYIQKTKQVEDATKSMQRSVQEGDKRQKGLIEDQIAALKELEKARVKANNEKDLIKINRQIAEGTKNLREFKQVGVEADATINKQTKSVNSLWNMVKKLAIAYLSVTVVMKGVKAIFNSTQQTGDLLRRELQGIKTAGDTLARAIATWNFEKLGERLKGARQAGKEYADEMDHIGDLERELQIEQARRNIQLAEQAKIYRNTALKGVEGYKLRQAAAEEYIRIAEEGEAKDLALLDLKLKAELKLARTQAGLQDEYVNATQERKDAIDNEIKSNLTMESTFAQFNDEIERYQTYRKNISAMSPMFSKIDVDAAIDMFTATGQLTEEIQKLPVATQNMIRQNLAELAKLPPEITAIAERYQTWGNVTDDVRISMTASMTAIEQKQADLEKGTIRANTMMELAGSKLAEEEDETLQKRLEKLAKFVEATARLRDEYEQAQIEQLTGVDRIRAEQEFELRQVQLLEDHLKTLGDLTEDHYKYLDGLRAAANKRAEVAELEYESNIYNEMVEHGDKVRELERQIQEDALELIEDNEKAKAELKIKFYEEDIQRLSQSTDPLAQLEIKRLQQLIAILRGEIAKASTDGGFSIWDIIDPKGELSEDKRQEIIDNVKLVVDNITAMFDEMYSKRLEDAQRTRELLDDQIQMTQDALNAEIELMTAGYANNVDAKRKELEELKKEREKALREEEKALKAKQQMESAYQAASIISAIANIFKGSSEFGPLGWIAAIAASAAMVGAFISAKTKAAAATKLAEGGAGTETGIIKGRSHREGGERFLDHVEVERGEMWGVLSKRATAKYGKQFGQIVTSFNRDQIPIAQMSDVHNNILVDVNQTNERLDRVQGELIKLNRHFGIQAEVIETPTARIIKRGNKTRIIRK